MQELNITTATVADLPTLLALNEKALPQVSSLTLDALHELLDQSCYFGVTRVRRRIAGFMLALDPSQEYRSLNYRWFCEHYNHFVYVDRIVVDDAFQHMGIGRLLYQDIERAVATTAAWLTCEVNLQPPNQGSLAFHRKLGFSEVGQQDTDGGNKRVSLLAKRLSGDIS